MAHSRHQHTPLETLHGMSNDTQKLWLSYRYNAVFSTLYAIEMVTAYPTTQDKPLAGWGRGIKYAKVWVILAPTKILKCSKAVDRSGPLRAYSSPMPRNGTMFSRSFRWPLGRKAKLFYSVTFCWVNHFKSYYFSASSKCGIVKALTLLLAFSTVRPWLERMFTWHRSGLSCCTPILLCFWSSTWNALFFL